MTATSPAGSATEQDSAVSNSSAQLTALVERIGQLLPAQGPLSGFAFLNPLQGLEDRSFEEGMMRGARLYGCRPYLTEDVYRDLMSTGRIRLEDISAVLRTELGGLAEAPLYPSGTRYAVRMAMVQHPLRSAPAEELRWFIAETNALARFSEEAPDTVRHRFLESTRRWVMRDVTSAPDTQESPGPRCQLLDSLVKRFEDQPVERWNEATWETFSLQLLWRVCREGLDQVDVPPTEVPRTTRHRDLLHDATGEDIDLLVHPLLIRFCAAYTDQGLSNWELPDRDRGLLATFCQLYRTVAFGQERWSRPLVREVARIESQQISAADLIVESLTDLGVPQDEWEEFLLATTLTLRGWAGILWQMEVREDRVPKPAPRGALMDLLAVRLLLERIALRELCARAEIPVALSLAGLRDQLSGRLQSRNAATVEQRSFFVFQLAQVMGWTPLDLYQLTDLEWASLIAEIEHFPSLARRRIFQLAFEHQLQVRILDAISIHNARPLPERASPQFQAVFCIDAREESFRRHLEEQSPKIETFGAAGFFGVAMYFRGVADAHFSAQCPVIVRPRHWVVEDMVYPFEESHQSRARSRRALGIAVHQIHLDSRSFGPGAVLSAGLGTLASIPLVMRILFPRATAKIRETLGRFVAPPLMTRLRLERSQPTPGPHGGEVGFTIEEMANLGERMLRDLALASGYARLIFFVGHGSACLNNPHKSTYDCGACTGNPGGANGRALAAMLNHPKVRQVLLQRGLAIPEDTVFVGGLHNTADDTVTLYDLDQIPATHYSDLEQARRAFDEACRRNAHERCRRFYSAPLNLSHEEALRHVKDRSEDLAQTRPEFGNATNALCFVGRRGRIRGLYFDRRCFMHSYDPNTDDANHTILGRILAPVIPVCNGINMQYYLSAMDSPGWGCGTKLPHNVTSLLGVMDGASSDLRCGLPAQGVEIHEPVRLLFVIESTPEAMLAIMKRDPVIGRILGNGWSQLAVLDPHSNRIQVYRHGEFQPYETSTETLPVAPSSQEWYRGWRENLRFAQIQPD